MDVNELLERVNAVGRRVRETADRLDNYERRRADQAPSIVEKLAELDEIEAKRRELTAQVQRDLQNSKPLTREEEAQIFDDHARMDSIYASLGRPCPKPYAGERNYLLRALGGLCRYRPTLTPESLRGCDEKVLRLLGEEIIACASRADACEADVLPGRMREVARVDKATGAKTIEFYRGDGGTYLRDWKPSGMRLVAIRDPARDHILRRFD